MSTGNIFSMETFLGQLDKIMEENRLVPGKDDREFDRLLGFDNQMYRWRSGVTKTIVMDTAVKIARQFHKSLDWLIFGHGPLVLQEFQEGAYESRQPLPVDTENIARVSSVVQTYLSGHRLRIGPKRFGKIIALGYEQCVTDNFKPEELDVKALMVLTALVEG
jgi:hypothetical protein